jgi:alpha-ketoglutaric semialdehyde dehydrogenase
MTTIELTGAMLLGAERVVGTEGTFHGVDPRTGKELEPTYGLGSRADVARAAQLAGQAFGVYRQTGPKERGAFLDTVADNVEALGDTLVERVQLETGIIEPRVRGELARTVGQLRLFAGVVSDGTWVGARLESALPERKPLPRPDIRQRKVPVGPVAVFGASNFPLAFSVAGGDTASALAAGCPVVVKAHSAHPGTSELVADAIARAVAAHGLPQGVFSMVFGSGREVGISLVTDPHIKAVGFTGSRTGGVALMEAAAGRPVPIPVYAEMSSLNPVFLLPGAVAADPQRLGCAFVESMVTGIGQLCTNPGLVFGVEGPDLDVFVGAAADTVRDTSAGVMLNEGIHSAFCAGVERLRRAEGVEEVATGRVDETIASGGAASLFTVSGDAFLADPSLQEEVFGASSLVVRLRDSGQFFEVLEMLEGQLTATAHATEEDFALAAELLPQLEEKVGRILFNGWPTGVDVGEAMVHGGPYPATSDGRSTSVGTLAIERFLRPVAYQNVPAALLPAAVDNENSLGLWRQVNGELGKH